MHPVLEQFTLKATKDPARRPPLMADLEVLGRFRRQMAANAFPPVNLAQMVFDRSYALDRIALAHTSADAGLRRMAVGLFAQYASTHSPQH